MEAGKEEIKSADSRENPLLLESMLIATSTSAVASLLRTVPPVTSITSLASAASSASESKFEYNYLTSPLMRRNLSGRPLPQKRGPPLKLKRLGTNNSHGKNLANAGRGHRRSEDFSTPPLLHFGTGSTSESAPGTPLHESMSDFNEPALPLERNISADDLPEIEEQFPGKVCAFCNLGERSQLGQGEMVKIPVSQEFNSLKEAYQPDRNLNDPLASMRPAAISQRKPRLSFKGRRSSSFDTSAMISELQEELNLVGHLEEPDLSTVVETSGHFYAHQACVSWSTGVNTSTGHYAGADKAMLRALSQRCSLCNSYGASVQCEVTQCTKRFHFPCSVSSGAFFNIKTFTFHCPDHIYQGSVVAGPDANCGACNSPGNVSNQLFCVTCGKHYHGSCVGVSVVSDVRLGWQCSDCRVCITCRTPGEDGKMLSCDTCSKSYHPYCVRPLLSNIPKMGWKCKNCRVCGDCGARTPGSGPSSRWHSCFTVCDSCYQQRNKGASCPLCGKAYRHSQREMTQCQGCRKYVHSSCDPESERTLCQRKKELNADYEYVCPVCKQNQNNWSSVSGDDSSAFLRGSQESLAPSEDSTDMDFTLLEDSNKSSVGLRGKPFQSIGKVAKKKLTGAVGRPKGSTKIAWGAAVSKKPKVAEFGRKRGPKPKIRGVFGVPGVGLQRPQGDTVSGSATEGEPCLESRLIICAAQDDFVLEQDVCVMCGAFGVDQEGRLISCAQCGQCYHPYCANVKLNKVVLEKGWRCLDCTICEGCGQKNDEARLLLCDECDISYHIYCMDPPLDYVPQGNWKCKWCSICQACGSNDPGVNSSWLNNYSLCGPCASLGSCAVCSQQYHEGELIIQCQQCERWLHGACDLIRNENEAERCSEDGYVCVLCRPADVPPPHLNPASQASVRIPTPPRSPVSTPETPRPKVQAHFMVDGVCLSENGMNHLRGLQLDLPRRKSRAKGTLDSSFDGAEGEKVDGEGEESPDMPKDGTVVTPREDGRLPDVPEGYSIVQGEGGVLVLRKKRQRNLQKLGIGGFQARRPWTRVKDKEDESQDPPEAASAKEVPNSEAVIVSVVEGPNTKPRRKPQRRKLKNKLVETYPSYLQEAFFGKELLESRKSESIDRNSDSDKEFDSPISVAKDVSVVQLSREEVAAIDAAKQPQVVPSVSQPTAQQPVHYNSVPPSPRPPPLMFSPRGPLMTPLRSQMNIISRLPLLRAQVPPTPRPAPPPPAPPEAAPPLQPAASEAREMIDDVAEDHEALKDILPLASDLLDSDDLVDALMKDGGGDLADENHSNLQSQTTAVKDELPDILNPHFSIDTIVSETGLPNMDSKDVEDLFKGVLTDESQESADSSFVGVNATPSPAPHALGIGAAAPSAYSVLGGAQHAALQGPTLSRALSASQGTCSPSGIPPPSPYPSEYSNSSGFSPAFSEPPPSPWTGGDHDVEMPSVSQRNSHKWEMDEALGLGATISAVLYANTNHAELKRDYPNWAERWKQIAKIWRSLPSDKKAPFLQKARENRAAARLQKSQQHSQQDSEKNIPVHRRVVESEQEKQWKQLQMARQQQQQQQQQQQPQQQQPIMMPSSESMNGNAPIPSPANFTGPIQVTRVRPPEIGPPLTPGPPIAQRGAFPQQQLRQPGPMAGPRTPGPQQPGQQQFDFSQTEAKPADIGQTTIKMESQDPMDVNGPSATAARQQLRDLLQRQQHMKSEDLNDAVNQPMAQQQFQQQQQHRFNQQFRFPLPPGSPNVPRPLNTMPLNQQQQMMASQRPRLLNTAAIEFRPPVPLQSTNDPRMRMMIHQQRPGFVGHPMQQANPSAAQMMRPVGPLGSPVLIPPQQQQPQQLQTHFQVATTAPEPMKTPVINPTLNDADHRKAEPILPAAENRPTDPEMNEPEPDADLVDLGMDDDELLGLGSDFNILEYADADLLDGQDVKGTVNTAEGGNGSPAMGTDFNILEYADPDLDTGDEVGSRKNLLDEHLDLADEDAKKEAEETAAKVAQGVSEFQAKFLEISQRQQQTVRAGESAVSVSSVAVVGSVRTSTSQQVTEGFGFHQPAQLPPPYRCPPPPYPGPPRNQLYGMGGGQGLLPASLPSVSGPVFRPIGMGVGCIPNPSLARRQDQRLLLEDLLEQEKREQRQQLSQQSQQRELTPEKPFLSDTDFEKLKSDVFGGEPSVCVSPPGLPNPHIQQHLVPQHMPQLARNPQHQQHPVQGMVVGQQQRMPFPQQQMYPHQQQHMGYMRTPMPQQQQQWPMQQQQVVVRPQQDPGIHPALMQTQAQPRPPLPPQLLPAPPPPPENPTTESERQQQAAYEQWLMDQQNLIRMQQSYYEVEVNKYRKQRKSLNSRQRQLRKNGQELNENDAADLERITTEQSALQKQLDQVRRQARQHSMLFQDYRGKQQKRQQQNMGQMTEGGYNNFPQQSQQQQHPPMQVQMHMQQQQTSPRALGGAVTPQSPHLLSPGHNMANPIRGPHPLGQAPMQGPPPSPMMVQQHSLGMMGGTPKSPVTPQPPQLMGNMAVRSQTPMPQQPSPMQMQQQQQQKQGPGPQHMMTQQYHQHVMQMQQAQPQSPRVQQLHSPMMAQHGTPQSPLVSQQPPPSPLLQQNQRMPMQQQQPMPAPSPVTGMQHSPMPVAMTPTPSPGIPNAGPPSNMAGNHMQQHHNPSPMAQHSPHASMMPSPRMGTPLSQRSEDAASPFSPGPLASPQPGLANLRLTSPQNHPPRQPSPQQHTIPPGRGIPTQGGMPASAMGQVNARPQLYADQVAVMRPGMPGNAAEGMRMHPAMMQRFARPAGPMQGDPSVMLRQRFPIQQQQASQQHFQHMQQQQQQQTQPMLHDQQQHMQLHQQGQVQQQQVPQQQNQQYTMVSMQQNNVFVQQNQQQQHQMQYMMQQQQQQGHYQQQQYPSQLQQQQQQQQQQQNFQNQMQQQMFNGASNLSQPPIRPNMNYGVQQIRISENPMASPRPSRPNSVPQSPAPYSHPGTPAQPAASPAPTVSSNRASPSAAGSTAPGTPLNPADTAGQPQNEGGSTGNSGGAGGGSAANSQVIPFIEYDSYGFPKIGLKGGSPLSPKKSETPPAEKADASEGVSAASNSSNSSATAKQQGETSTENSSSETPCPANLPIKEEIKTEPTESSIQPPGSPAPQEQNALLKQLLQGSSPPTPPSSTTNASRPSSLVNLLAQSPSSSAAPSTPTTTRSLLGTPSLASQLAQPIGPSPLNIPTAQIAQIVSRVPQPTPILRPTLPNPSMSPRYTTPPASSIPTMSIPQKPPPAAPLVQTIKEEVIEPQAANPVQPATLFPLVKLEGEDCLDPVSVETRKDANADELKKAKRRQYQQKRRQSGAKDGPQSAAVSPGASGASGASSPAFGSQLSSLMNTQAKRRLRKGSKYEEDYDTYIESLLTQLRTLPAMTIVEPDLGRNYVSCSLYGAGETTKLNDRSYSLASGELRGEYGSACLSDSSDYYNTRPFGDASPVPPKSPPQTQRGFYHQEFAWPRLSDNDSRSSTPCRDSDTPDTVVSSSSPECVLHEPPVHYPGLKYIDDSDTEDASQSKECKPNRTCVSPDIPLLAPLPIHPQPSLRLADDIDKENQGLAREQQALKARFGLSPPVPLRDAGNVTVTLTLSAAAAEDVTGVLSRLAALLRVPPPTGYEVIERTTTPPSQRLGLYRYKGKDGKEGAPVDIQSILNGTARFCRHCDVVILGANMICKKASQVGLGASADSISSGDEDVYFCSTACFVQFAVSNRVGLTPEQKAAAVVGHSSGQDSARTPTEPGRVDVKVAAAVANIFTNAAAKRSIASTATPRPLLQPLDRKSRKSDDAAAPPPAKKWKDVRYRSWSSSFQQSANQQKKYKKPRENELTEMLYRSGICIRPVKIPDDNRECMFCGQPGDGVSDGPARLLNYDVDRWVHLNCALWHEEVYETVNGALMNVDLALKAGLVQNCALCERPGATVKCFKLRCSSVYHLSCAIKENCVFYKNKTVYCSQHVPKGDKDDQLTTLSVFRRVYINRDENRQVAAVVHHGDQNYVLRLGSLTLKCVGQLLPHQLAAFHTSSYIYPIGYQVVRFYWSPKNVHKRCRYTCTIGESDNRPQFIVTVEERNQEEMTFTDWSCQGVWQQVLTSIEDNRRQAGAVRLFSQFLTGEDLFGLNEPAIIRLLESLPGIETLPDYNFKYGRNPLFELPLAINPTGCARAEPKLRTHFKRPHTQRTLSSARNPYNHAPSSGGGLEPPGPYSKQFVHSKSSQYKKMKLEWRHNLYLARSKIQGLGLFAARDIEKHTMVIEYIGELIRAEVAEIREKKYEAENRGIYMFRLDEQRVIDASLTGGLARYINHSCNPNCVAEAVEVERDLKIIIFANRRIFKGEELSYDYKFDIEDDHKIPCLCGAPNCRKWMN